MTETVTPLELRITRVLPATPAEVFDAYTDAEKQKIWFSILDERSGFPVPEIRDFFVDEVWNGALARITAYLERAR